MSLPPKMLVALGMFLAGMIGCVVVLSGLGLDQAEKWASVVGVFVSAGIGAAGLVLGWRALRQPGATAGSAAVSATRTGPAVARGPGSRANTGVSGVAPGGSTVAGSGAAEAEDGGRANTGVENP
ncbi:hypothetical protein ABZU25_25990 [Micromonospora sp. NPDC005215]|uniref:hypothetical protein n=1 Tax=Micromonospora sp. NPDC005215 TaxID=3157024 RepID=UPI0033B915A2